MQTDTAGSSILADTVPFVENGYASPAPAQFAAYVHHRQSEALVMPQTPPASHGPSMFTWSMHDDALLPAGVQTNEVQEPTSNGLLPAVVPAPRTPQQAVTPRSASHRRKMEPGHVKRPCNAFILFRSHAVATNLVPKEVERDHRNISRIISHMWRSLGKEERALWEAQADAEKERHRLAYPDYKYRPGSRRNNVHRRNVRKLSSTEHQCEQIADVILKACGRPGVKRRRSSAPKVVMAPPQQDKSANKPAIVELASAARPPLRRSFSSNAMTMPPTNEVRITKAASHSTEDAMPPPTSVDSWERKLPRRSSSAPPIHRSSDGLPGGAGLDTQFALLHAEPIDWVLDTPLLASEPSPFGFEASAATVSPLQTGLGDLQGPKDSLLPPPSIPAMDDTTGMEQTFQQVSLNAGADHTGTVLGMFNLDKLPIPDYLLPPVSPKTNVQPTYWPGSLLGLPSDGGKPPATVDPSLWHSRTEEPEHESQNKSFLGLGATSEYQQLGTPLSAFLCHDSWQPSA